MTCSMRWARSFTACSATCPSTRSYHRGLRHRHRQHHRPVLPCACGLCQKGPEHQPGRGELHREDRVLHPQAGVRCDRVQEIPVPRRIISSSLMTSWPTARPWRASSASSTPPVPQWRASVSPLKRVSRTAARRSAPGACAWSPLAIVDKMDCETGEITFRT